MSEKPPELAKLPKSLANLPLERRAYSTHPRVQKAFRRLVNWKKLEKQNKLSPKILAEVDSSEEPD